MTIRFDFHYQQGSVYVRARQAVGWTTLPLSRRLLIGTGLRGPQSSVMRPLQRRITYDHDSERGPRKFSSLHLRSRLLRNGALLGCKIVDLSRGARERDIGRWRTGVGQAIGWGSRTVPGDCGRDPGGFKRDGRIELLEWSELR